MKMYNNGPRKAMMYGGAAKRKPMMYGGMATKKKKKMAAGGNTSKFGMLSVNAGMDNNPMPTAADRIAGATKGMRKTSA